MRILIFLFFLLPGSCAMAQMQVLPLPNNGAFGAVFPCSGDRKSVDSGVGITNAIQCRIEDVASVCAFLISEHPLDIKLFNKYGWKYIEEVNHQYALLTDRNYKKISGRVVRGVGLGEAYAYEFVREQDGVLVNVKGSWLVSNSRLLRGAVNCAPNGTHFMKLESDLFLKSLIVVK